MSQSDQAQPMKKVTLKQLEARDHYGRLRVPRAATLEAIKKAYRTYAKKYHPDTTALRDGAERFRLVTDAYETLSDPQKRAVYDLRQAYAARTASPAPAPQPKPAVDLATPTAQTAQVDWRTKLQQKMMTDAVTNMARRLPKDPKLAAAGFGLDLLAMWMIGGK